MAEFTGNVESAENVWVSDNRGWITNLREC